MMVIVGIALHRHRVHPPKKVVEPNTQRHDGDHGERSPPASARGRCGRPRGEGGCGHGRTLSTPSPDTSAGAPTEGGRLGAPAERALALAHGPTDHCGIRNRRRHQQWDRPARLFPSAPSLRRAAERSRQRAAGEETELTSRKADSLRPTEANRHRPVRIGYGTGSDETDGTAPINEPTGADGGGGNGSRGSADPAAPGSAADTRLEHATSTGTSATGPRLRRRAGLRRPRDTASGIQRAGTQRLGERRRLTKRRPTHRLATKHRLTTRQLARGSGLRAHPKRSGRHRRLPDDQLRGPHGPRRLPPAARPAVDGGPAVPGDRPPGQGLRRPRYAPCRCRSAARAGTGRPRDDPDPSPDDQRQRQRRRTERRQQTAQRNKQNARNSRAHATDRDAGFEAGSSANPKTTPATAGC